MNIEFFREGLELASYGGGLLLNAEQQALIENSLIILQSENKFQYIFFWGCINGLENDYYIALGYLKDCLRGRRFFFSTNCVQWLLLPPWNPEQCEASLLASSKFQGDITKITEVVMDPKFIIQPDGNMLPAIQEKRLLKEIDRLSCIVNMITEETAIMPRGALCKRTDGKSVYSPSFHGLSLLESSQLTNFQLYRTPQNRWNSNLLKHQDYNYATDIFDSIDLIVPEHKSFALTLQNDRGLVLIKSLYWPGMMFFHKCHSQIHGFCYVGDGRKNFDLLFML